jgi:hypothetical protein
MTHIMAIWVGRRHFTNIHTSSSSATSKEMVMCNKLWKLLHRKLGFALFTSWRDPRWHWSRILSWEMMIPYMRMKYGFASMCRSLDYLAMFYMALMCTSVLIKRLQWWILSLSTPTCLKFEGVLLFSTKPTYQHF